MSKRNPLARLFTFIQKKRDVKDIGIAIEILEQIIDGLMKEIEDEQKELEKLNENVDAYNEEREGKNKLDDGRFERYMKDKNIRTKQENIIDDIKTIYNNEILPHVDSFPEEVKKIGDATNTLKN